MIRSNYVTLQFLEQDLFAEMEDSTLSVCLEPMEDAKFQVEKIQIK